MESLITKVLGVRSWVKSFFVREFEELDKEEYNKGPQKVTPFGMILKSMRKKYVNKEPRSQNRSSSRRNSV